MWAELDAFTRIPGVELSEEAFDRLVAEGRAVEFEKYVEAYSMDFARWIAFQFTSEISHAHMRRADPWVKVRCQPIIAEMIKKKRFRKLRQNLSAMAKRNELVCPEAYRDLIGTSFEDFSELCIAYAMSVVFRGFSYALAIGSAAGTTPPLYYHHWVRDRIVHSFEENGIGCRTKPGVIHQFPWGRILGRVFDPIRPFESRSASKISDVLLGLREQSSQVADFLESWTPSVDDMRWTSDRISDTEVQVADWLHSAGITLRRKKENGTFVGKCLKELGITFLKEAQESSESPMPGNPIGLGAWGGAALGFGILIEQVSTVRPTNFLRSLDYKTHVRFLRNSFWKDMEDPGIRPALRIVKADRAGLD